MCNHISLTCYVSYKGCTTKNNAWFKIFVIRLLINIIYACNSQHDLGNFDRDDQTIYHDITDTSEISTADDNIFDIDNAEDNGSTSSDDHNVMESGDYYLQGIVSLLESSTIAENNVLVKSVNAELKIYVKIIKRFTYLSTCILISYLIQLLVWELQ